MCIKIKKRKFLSISWVFRIIPFIDIIDNLYSNFLRNNSIFLYYYLICTLQFVQPDIW